MEIVLIMIVAAAIGAVSGVADKVLEHRRAKQRDRQRRLEEQKQLDFRAARIAGRD